MNKVLLYLIGTIIILGGGFFLLNNYIYNEKQAFAAKDYKDAEYLIGGERIRLQNGVSEKTTGSDSASPAVTRYFGNEVRRDLNDDGREDVVFLLTQETGGSGVFFYVVAAINTERGYVGSEGLLLGDRIAPQTTELGRGKIVIVNYADRAVGADFASQPSEGKSIWLLLDPETLQFGEVAQNFEGEADPSRMSLGMKKWSWLSALYSDGKEIKPQKPDAFTLTFGDEGRFTATTDCSSVAGGYIADTDSITFSEMISTRMFCEGAQESEFTSLLGESQGYHFTSRGELILDLKLDSGTVTFK